MHLLHLGWQQSAALCIALTAIALISRPFPRVELVHSFAREFAVVLALFGSWQYIGHYVRTHSAGAMDRAREVQELQAWLHLPDERLLQLRVLPHEWVVQGINAYYASMHLTGMSLFLVWVWWRHRESFGQVRNTVAGSTLLCLVVQSIPVAPPRLLSGAGFVDTALVYGQSVYGSYTTGLAAQLTAMPSVHVGWAFIIGWYITKLGRGPGRWLGCLHLVVTVLVVVLTANHWWLDGAAAVLITLGVLAAQSGLPYLFRRYVLAGRRPQSVVQEPAPQFTGQ
ncbi:MAG TPA: phosphatase PAP2 family protein [Kineosporiaceae bacterium]|nr:phosphatase PAP2 family protein [Kineosporiaceae bacterium]